MARSRPVSAAAGVLLAVLLAVATGPALGFYLPGVAPQAFNAGDRVEVKSVKMTSTKRQLPFPYYYLPFCRPHTLKNVRLNLGEVLRGDRITNTPYELQMDRNVSCRLLCPGESDMPDAGPAAGLARLYSRTDVSKFERFINAEYRVHWIMDNLPGATKVGDKYAAGYPVGFVNQDKQTHLCNHIIIVGKIHKTSDLDEPDQWRIVGFEVRARSVAADRYKRPSADSLACEITPASGNTGGLVLDSQSQEKGSKFPVVWSYAVQWEPSPIAWASRWDTYLKMDDTEIHWFSIVNSLVTVFFLSAIFGFILLRTLRRDIDRYNEEDKEEAMEQTGWKLVHGDVFRPPVSAFWLCVCLGSGIQILCMVGVSVLFAMFGMLSPASRGSLVTAAVLIFVFCGVFAGYFGGRMYKVVKGQHWKQAAIATAVTFPGFGFGTCFVLNFFIWGQQSSGAVPFTTMLALLCLWFFISTPLVMVGFYFGFRMKAYEQPVSTNQIPRQVPEQQWYMSPLVSVLLAGILPFGAVFIELFFILTAVWEDQFYYLFGFLFIVVIILLVSCSEIAIVMTYLQLCSEDYHWWWRSFFISGGCAFYVFLYAVFYFFTKLEITELTPALLYFGYTAIMVTAFWLLTGTIGFFATYAFVTLVYGSIKID